MVSLQDVRLVVKNDQTTLLSQTLKRGIGEPRRSGSFATENGNIHHSTRYLPRSPHHKTKERSIFDCIRCAIERTQQTVLGVYIEKFTLARPIDLSLLFIYHRTRIVARIVPQRECKNLEMKKMEAFIVTSK